MQQRRKEVARVAPGQQIVSLAAHLRRELGSDEGRSRQTIRFRGRHQDGADRCRPRRRNSHSVRQDGRRKNSLRRFVIKDSSVFTTTATSTTTTTCPRNVRQQQHVAAPLSEGQNRSGFRHFSISFWKKFRRRKFDEFVRFVSRHVSLQLRFHCHHTSGIVSSFIG